MLNVKRWLVFQFAQINLCDDVFHDSRGFVTWRAAIWNVLLMTFNFNLPQIVFSSLSRSEWALTLPSHQKDISPSILSSLPDDDRVRRDSDHRRGRTRSGRRGRRGGHILAACFGLLVLFLNVYMHLYEGLMLTAHPNPFISIPHHAWLHHSPKRNPIEQQNWHPVREEMRSRRGCLVPGVKSLYRWLVTKVLLEWTLQSRAACRVNTLDPCGGCWWSISWTNEQH